MNFIIKSNFITSESKNSLKTYENHYLVCENGVISGIFRALPEQYKNLDIIDYKDKIIISGMTDLHIHAPQYAFRGLDGHWQRG